MENRPAAPLNVRKLDPSYDKVSSPAVFMAYNRYAAPFYGAGANTNTVQSRKGSGKNRPL
mgnify:CR=1 FL=1|jgi:hypothetical protein